MPGHPFNNNRTHSVSIVNNVEDIQDAVNLRYDFLIPFLFFFNIFCHGSLMHGIARDQRKKKTYNCILKQSSLSSETLHNFMCAKPTMTRTI